MMQLRQQAAVQVKLGSNSLVRREPAQAFAAAAPIPIALRDQPSRIERGRGNVLPSGRRVASSPSRLQRRAIILRRETTRRDTLEPSRVYACSFQPTAETHLLYRLSSVCVLDASTGSGMAFANEQKDTVAGAKSD